MRTIALTLALSLLAGCASEGALRPADRLELYRQNAGAPVDSFRYWGRVSSWTPLGDSAVAIWTRPTEAWLLELQGPCPDLQFAKAIQLSDSLGSVHVRFDKVTPITGAPGPVIPCPIDVIRPLDVPALREAEKQARERG